MVNGTHYIRSHSPEGPFELVEETFFAGTYSGTFTEDASLKVRMETSVSWPFSITGRRRLSLGDIAQWQSVNIPKVIYGIEGSM